MSTFFVFVAQQVPSEERSTRKVNNLVSSILGAISFLSEIKLVISGQPLSSKYHMTQPGFEHMTLIRKTLRQPYRMLNTGFHYENMPNILKILLPKHENFQIKNSDIFHNSAQNIDCGYSWEPPSSHNLCFWAKIRKLMYTPVNPSFTI